MMSEIKSGDIEESHNKSDDKKVIEMEEKEKMLNEENKVQNAIAEVEAATVQKVEDADDNKHRNNVVEQSGKIIKTEGREVQPKKIPIGGIQMPGFFTRSKSKEKCKDVDATIEEAELLESTDKEKKDENSQPITTRRIKFPNPFKKSKVNEEDGAVEPKERKRLLDSIRLPLVSVFPKRTNKSREEEKLENQSGKAGLASVETLDDTDKKEDELKSIPLYEKKNLENEETERTWRKKLKAYRVVISGVLIFLLLVIITVAIIIPGRIRYGPVIRDGKYVETITSCGKVEGILHDSAIAFRDIPYARPPLKDLRFKPAQPLNNISFCWNSTEILEAYNSTKSCLQIHTNGTITGEEDCLTLDVVTPAIRYENPLPVVVLIGSDTLMGGSPGKMRPSARYARARDVVYVRPNFRLGALGFLAAEMLTNSVHLPTSGNYALTDILEALKWIQLNIEHFGGDKCSVTLFGHRAGATLVTALAHIKDARKYFHQVWASSGSSIFPQKPLEEVQRKSVGYLDSISCESVECLREKDPVDLISAVEDLWRKPIWDLPTPDEITNDRHEWLVMDGKLIRENFQEMWKREEGLPVQIVLGTTSHAAFSDKLLYKYKEWTSELVIKHINESKIGHVNLTEQVLKLYHPITFQSLVQIVSDIRIVCPLYFMAQEMPNTTFYVVNQTRGELEIADIDADIDAIFGRYIPIPATQKRYVTAIQQLFYYFISHNKVGFKRPNRVIVIGQDPVGEDTYGHCEFWKKNQFVPKYAQLD